MERWHSCFLGIICAILINLSGGCVSLPPNTSRMESHALADTNDTRLAQTLAPIVAQHPGQSGFHPMASGVEALVARLALADAAQRSIDAQYYIWDPDSSGKLLAAHLLAAADRGVRVRILLDDFGSTSKDEGLLALDSHPNVEVRLFNPIALRGTPVLGMMMDFSRTNRRMHNKSFTVDNQAGVVGGRNVGDDYFAATPDADMADFDVVAAGPIIRDVSTAFDQFWNCSASYPMATLVPKPVPPESLVKLRADLVAHVQSMSDSPFESQLRQTNPIEQLTAPQYLYFGQASLFYDSPAKSTEQSNAPQDRLLPQLAPTAESVQRELVILSPYFVPGKEGVEFFRRLRNRGVRIVILTNSLASCDATPVHAGYSRYRKDLVGMGVEMYELKPTANLLAARKNKDKDDDDSHTGSSTASLHAKTFVFDRDRVFVGSLNLDQRSANLNTEIGVVFQNAELASQMVDRLLGRLPEIAWRVEAAPDASGKSFKLNWVTQTNGATQRLTEEPRSSFSKRMTVLLVSWLPVESQL